MYEGQEITWVGLGDESTEGDRGQLLAFAGKTSAHVLWTTGSRAGSTTLEDVDDLTAVASLVEDSLEVGSMQTFAARQVFETQGEAGVLNAMARLGHLTGFPTIAEEAFGLISSRIRMDPSFRQVTAQLDDEEGEALVRLASVCLIRDAFGGTEHEWSTSA